MTKTINISAKEAISAMKILSLAPEVAGIPSASFIRIYSKGSKLQLSLGGDLFASVEMKGKGETTGGLIFVGRREFLSFFQTSSHKPFQIEIGKGKLIIWQGARKVSLSGTAEGVGYSESRKISSSAKEVALSNRLLRALDIACSCSSGGPNTALHCTYLKSDTLLASDQILAFKEQLKKPVSKHELLLPMPVIPLLKTEGLKKLLVENHRVVLEFSEGKIFHPLPEESVKFPYSTVESLLRGQTYTRNRKKHAEERSFCALKHFSKIKDWPEVFSMRVGKLDELLRRFSTYLSGVEKMRSSVTANVAEGDGSISFLAETQYAKFHEKTELRESAKKNFSAKLPVEFLLPFSKYWAEKDPKKSVHIYCDKESPCLLVCGSSRLIVPSHALSEKNESKEGEEKRDSV